MTSYSDAELYWALRTVADHIGHPPTAREYREHAPSDAPSARTIFTRHGSATRPWLTALEQAGLDPDVARHAGSGYGWRDRMRAINYVAAYEARWPSLYRYRQVYRDHELQGLLPSASAIVAAEGDWEPAVEQANGYFEAVEILIESGPSIGLTNPGSTSSFLRHAGLVRSVKAPTDVGGSRSTILFLPGHSPQEVIAEWRDAVDVSNLSDGQVRSALSGFREVFPDAHVRASLESERDP
jgi:hypothetical protein